jgi:hypothetical protein
MLYAFSPPGLSYALSILWEYKLWSSLCSFLKPLIIHPSWAQNILLSTLFSNTLRCIAQSELWDVQCLWQWLIHYMNIMLELLHCLRHLYSTFFYLPISDVISLYLCCRNLLVYNSSYTQSVIYIWNKLNKLHPK